MSYAEEYAREFIEKNYSEGMAFSTVLFVIAILIAITSVVCFVLAPFYSKGINKGAKTAGRIISTFDFIIGILLIIAFMAIAAIISMASSGAFSDLPNSIKNVLIGIVYAPMRFGMEVKSTYDNPCDASLAFYALYFVTAGLLGLVAFIVSCVARGKYNAANGLIRGAAAPAGAPQYNPYQPYGQPNAQQGYPQQYGQNAQQGYPQQYGQNAQQSYSQQYGQNAQQGYSQQYGQNIPQGYPQQYQQPAPQNIPQDNAQYQPAQQEVPQNIPQDNAQYQPAQQDAPQDNAQYQPAQQDAPQDNAQYQPAQQEVPQNIPQDNAQYQPAQQEVPQNIPQDNAQYQPVSHPAQQETANTEAPVQADVAQAAPVQQASSSFCGNCGSPVTPGASFCQNCGNKIN